MFFFCVFENQGGDGGDFFGFDVCTKIVDIMISKYKSRKLRLWKPLNVALVVEELDGDTIEMQEKNVMQFRLK